ncbi:MAG: lysophospholipid acyltransferase family protein [Lachnospiraceae bacterium]
MAKEEFRMLSKEEEGQLSLDEIKMYYADLREFLRLSNYKDYNEIQMQFREIANKYLWRIILRRIRNYDLVVDAYENIPQSPVIYAFHHAGIVDAENVVEALPEHAMLLAGDDLDKISRFLLNLIGTVFVTRLNKKSREESKIELMKALSKGKSVIVFPEAMWNMSPNKIHLPLTWGILDMARKVGAPVIPVAQEYFYDEKILDGKERIESIHIRFGSPVYISAEDNLNVKLEEFDEKFSTVRWSIWEEKGIFKRKDLSPLLYKNFVACKINSFPQVDLEHEYQCVYNGTSEFYKFHHLNIVPCDENGQMLPTKHVKHFEKIVNHSYK